MYFFVVLVALAFGTLTKGVVLTDRDCSYSGYMNGKVYCYVGIATREINSNLYTIDVAQYFGQSTDLMRDKWEAVRPTKPFNPELRRLASAIVLPDGRRLLVQGGYSAAKLSNQTIIYDTTTNSWESMLPYTEINRGIRQIYSSSLANLPNGLVGFFGGSEQFVNQSAPQVTISGQTMPYFSASASWVGFTNLQMYAPEAKSWAPFNPQINPPPNYYTNSQTATLDSRSGKVYYLGGEYHIPASTVGFQVGFGWTYTFNTNSGAWTNETFGGDIPSSRLYHTANLLPTSRNILLYGGSGDATAPSADYCYTLNLEDNTWTKQKNVNVPLALNGARYYHTTVLINSTLMILIGRSSPENLNLPFLTLNVADVKNISYIPNFNVYPVNMVTLNNNNNTFPNNTNGAETNLPISSNSGLSKDAIGGIVAGAVVVLILIFAIFILCIRKKRKSREKQIEDNHEEQMHVDWDKIDKQYREVSPINSDAKSSPNTYESIISPSVSVDVVKPSNGAEVVTPSIDLISVKPSSNNEQRSHNVVKPDAL